MNTLHMKDTSSKEWLTEIDDSCTWVVYIVMMGVFLVGVYVGSLL